VLVISEESRLGREQIETAYLLKQIITCGVRVVYYLEDRERTLDSPTDKILLAVSGFADEVERDKARQRTYDAMCRKALIGHVTGGVVFGYENVPVLTPDGKRDHVERRILEPEAAVIRRIFTLSAEGLGTRRIAHTLNAEGAPAPRPRRGGRPQAWDPATIYAMLTQEVPRLMPVRAPGPAVELAVGAASRASARPGGSCRPSSPSGGNAHRRRCAADRCPTLGCGP
jgi:site-specific DNA recombinase